MTRSMLGSLALVCALVAGCSASTTLEIDGGATDAGLGSDAGDDANVMPPIDAFVATDAIVPPRDAARSDAGPHDAGTLLPPIDATSPFSDSGTGLGDPAWVPLTVLTDGTMCPPLTPCGGDVVGTWDVGGGCFEVPLGDVMRCPGATATASGMSRGRVIFDGTIAHRVAQSEIDVQVTIPRFCASFAGGCMAIQTMIQMQQPDAACATEADMSCLCQIRVTNVIDDTDGYTISGDEIVGATSGKHWAYCVSGDTLTYQDVSTTGMREPGIIDLTRR